MTIISEIYLYLTKLILMLKHSAKLRRYNDVILDFGRRYYDVILDFGRRYNDMIMDFGCRYTDVILDVVITT